MYRPTPNGSSDNRLDLTFFGLGDSDGHEQEAAIRDIFEAHARDYVHEIYLPSLRNFDVTLFFFSTDLSNQFLLKTIPFETKTVSQDGSSARRASCRHASVGDDVKHF